MTTTPPPKPLPAWQVAILRQIFEQIRPKLIERFEDDKHKLKAALGPNGLVAVTKITGAMQTLAEHGWPPLPPAAVKACAGAEKAGAALGKLGREGVPPLSEHARKLMRDVVHLADILDLRLATPPKEA